MKTISVKQLQEKLKSSENVQFIDVRENYEFDICNIPGFVNIPMAEITDRISDLHKDGELIISCKSGKRAAAVGNLLETDFNFENVIIVTGGIIAYAEEVDSTLELY